MPTRGPREGGSNDKGFIVPCTFVYSIMGVQLRKAKSEFVAALIVLTAMFYLYQASNIGLGFAQTNEDISITIANSSYAPMTNVHGNQLNVSVNYQVNDESLENEKVNGIMKVYSSNGTLIHSSSFPDGFVAEKKGGTKDFKTTIRNPELKELIANVTFVDLERVSTLSNTVTTEVNLQESDTSSTTTSTQDNENGSTSDSDADTEDEDEDEDEEE
jgi:hypothetical protein